MLQELEERWGGSLNLSAFAKGGRQVSSIDSGIFSLVVFVYPFRCSSADWKCTSVIITYKVGVIEDMCSHIYCIYTYKLIYIYIRICIYRNT